MAGFKRIRTEMFFRKWQTNKVPGRQNRSMIVAKISWCKGDDDECTSIKKLIYHIASLTESFNLFQDVFLAFTPDFKTKDNLSICS